MTADDHQWRRRWLFGRCCLDDGVGGVGAVGGEVGGRRHSGAGADVVAVAAGVVDGGAPDNRSIASRALPRTRPGGPTQTR